MKIIHGGDIYTDSTKNWLDYSANINPLGIPENVKTAYSDSINTISSYPDPLCRELTVKIGQFENLEPQKILCGSGAADLIYRICYAIAPKTALIPEPTFSEYESALKNINCKIKHFYLNESSNFEIENSIIDFMENAEIIFLCNPNNPTGSLIKKETLKSIIENAVKKNTYVIIDECFNEFIENSYDYTAKKYLLEYDRLIILKAFTKIFALPGIRLGYILINNNSLRDKIYQSGAPWSVSSTAQMCGCTAVNEVDFILKTQKTIKTENDYLTNELKKIGFKVYPSKTNFILFKSPYIINLNDSLKEKGILIRNCKNFEGLDDSYYRIAVKLRNDNSYLIKCLKEIVQK